MNKILDVEKILEMMPHRYPFLLLDRLLKVEKDEFAIGLKNVTINEPFFLGHFPKQKVMPGVLIVECMAQTSGALVVNSFGEKAKGKLVYFMSIEKARFRKLVTPGDQLIVEVKKKFQHPFYGKVISRSIKIHAHDEKNNFKEGVLVQIIESKPISKLKTWQVIDK